MYILRVRMRERYILRPPKFVCMRVRVRIRVHVTGGVLARGLTCVGRLSEQPHWRWPKQGAAVAKQGGLGELGGLCKVYRPKRRPAEGAVLFRPIMWLYSASVVLGSTLHLALAIFQQGIPCFGHRPVFYEYEARGGRPRHKASTREPLSDANAQQQQEAARSSDTL